MLQAPQVRVDPVWNVPAAQAWQLALADVEHEEPPAPLVPVETGHAVGERKQIYVCLFPTRPNKDNAHEEQTWQARRVPSFQLVPDEHEPQTTFELDTMSV